MSRNIIETLTGAFVLIVAAWFLMFFMEQNTGVSIQKGRYNLIAKFEQIDGITSGTPVRIGGVKVGVVTSQVLDPQTYFAVVKMSIDNTIKIPEDSTAKVSSEGLVGGKYLSIVPGADDIMLANNGEIKYTQSSISIENLISKMVFSSADKDTKSETAAPATTSAEAPTVTTEKTK